MRLTWDDSRLLTLLREKQPCTCKVLAAAVSRTSASTAAKLRKLQLMDLAEFRATSRSTGRWWAKPPTEG